MKIVRYITLAAVLGSTSYVLAQEVPVEGPAPTSALINVTAKGATLDPSQLKLQINRHDAPITGVDRVQPAAAQIAILIDDGLRSQFGLQLNDMKAFIQGLPPKSQVLLGYMQNGGVRTNGGFTTDREQVLSELRIPLSAPGVSASPYFSLSEFVKQWPASDPGARFVLLLTNGVDPYNGSTSPMNQDSPYVQTAQEDAQRAGVAVYSIYFPDSRMRGGSFSGQSYLTQVGQATGGELFNIGSIPPVSIAPYLKKFQERIGESYVVNFMASTNREKRDTLAQIKLTTSQPGIKIHAPDGVHPGVSQ